MSHPSPLEIACWVAIRADGQETILLGPGGVGHRAFESLAIQYRSDPEARQRAREWAETKAALVEEAKARSQHETNPIVEFRWAVFREIEIEV